MLVVGLSARKQGGKNTAARHVSEHFRYKLYGQADTIVKEYAYADSLKKMCMDLFDLEYEQCYGNDDEKNTLTKVKWSSVLSTPDSSIMTAREVLQWFGTNIVRRMVPNAWVNATLKRIKKDNPAVALVTDVRFPNEVAGIHALGGKVIRLLRSPVGDLHESERALDPEVFDWHQFDAVLDNRNMTIEEQRRPVVDLILQWYSDMYLT